MQRWRKTVLAIFATLGATACSVSPPASNPLQSSNGPFVLQLAFNGAPAGSCTIDAPDSRITNNTQRSVDVITLTGGIATSTLFCQTAEGRIFTTAHRALASPEVQQVNILGVGAVQPGTNRFSGTSQQTNGTFSIQGNFLWERG